MPRSRWTVPRLARAAFLCGRGYPVDKIAADIMVASHSPAVTSHLASVGIVASEPGADVSLLAVPTAVLADLRVIARGRGETADQLVGRLLTILSKEPTLATNVLDDA